MKLLVPLYIYPLRDGELATEWRQMKEASEAGVSVVAIVNPGSGPGTEDDRSSYETGVQALYDSGVQVIGYVATGYGIRAENQVKGDIDRYKEWYGRWLTGVFLDETPPVADDLDKGDGVMRAKYTEYRQHVRGQMGDAAAVVMNTGMMLTESALTNAVGGGVVWNVLENSLEKLVETYGKVALPNKTTAAAAAAGNKKSKGKKEKKQKKKNKTSWWKRLFRGAGGGKSGGGGDGGGDGAGAASRWKTVEGTPPGAPAHVKGKAAFMVHGTKGLSYEALCHWVGQLQDGGWTHAYLTDKVFDPTSCNTALHNPWDALPSYWGDLVKAVVEMKPSSNDITGDGKSLTPRTIRPSAASSKFMDSYYEPR